MDSVYEPVDKVLEGDHVAEKSDNVADEHGSEAAVFELGENAFGGRNCWSRAFGFLSEEARLGEEDHRVGDGEAGRGDVRIELN